MADERYLDQQEQSGDADGPAREMDALRMFGTVLLPKMIASCRDTDRPAAQKLTVST
jgi:hypothetical protein